MVDSNVSNWICDDVCEWLSRNDFAIYTDLFLKHKIDGQTLLAIQESDLRQPPLQLKVLGDIKRLFACIKVLQEQTFGESFCSKCADSVDTASFHYGKGSPCRTPSQGHYFTNRQDSSMSTESLSDSGEIMDEELEKIISRQGAFSKNLDPEIFKTVLSFVYVFFVFLLTSFVMVVVHDRVPDTQKYPPLPDLFLDNIPYIPWAFEVCELVGSCLFLTWFGILFFHKHRFILMRRMYSMLGTVFLLRCVTMLITSLSVPGVHLQCEQKFGTWYAKLTRTYEIWSGFGMSIHGVKSCGDYMFSGHTSCITLLNFFITEYTPRKMYYIHTATWVGNLFGIFFILAAHEHYSIDVFIAFYITSRLFLYYHTLANNRSLMLRDKKRRRIWFPLFSYFESKCDGIVPNEYEWPLPYPKSFVKYFEKKKKKH